MCVVVYVCSYVCGWSSPTKVACFFFASIHSNVQASLSLGDWGKQKKKNSINGIQETWIILRDESLFHGFSAYFFSLQLSSPSSNLRLERNLRVWLFLSDLLWVLLAWLIVWTVISKIESKVVLLSCFSKSIRNIIENIENTFWNFKCRLTSWDEDVTEHIFTVLSVRWRMIWRKKLVNALFWFLLTTLWGDTNAFCLDL